VSRYPEQSDVPVLRSFAGGQIRRTLRDALVNFCEEEGRMPDRLDALVLGHVHMAELLCEPGFEALALEPAPCMTPADAAVFHHRALAWATLLPVCHEDMSLAAEIVPPGPRQDAVRALVSRARARA
jgi:hypothetical protein